MAPAGPPSWFSQNWKWLVGIGCGLGVFCCGGFGLLFALGLVAQSVDTGPGSSPADPSVAPIERARVDCGTPGPGGVDCQLKRTAGTRAISVCWDLEITCKNGGVMVNHGCGSLAEGVADGTVNLPAEGFSNQDGCDEPSRGAVKNLDVTLE